ncbi:hypothetical protein CFP65_2361 [Kitasatospora sp. MMS16-BH015]|uniref:SCO2584 family spore wall biosynthesis protein n=1 Tax=Kitasatospora sp. MMS16-BH015 TaxID=2018025 RepID=UPI000CA35ABD|nr:hypothetical protein [Kitasatospora sp. MMS16-BH015]AUG77195.1 hypothetical protein CFP65_2361 [Kitasatospora sp. MMS16-BH015]
MAEDVGGSPYSGGADHGDADDEFATVVFDEAFVRSAAVHEPSARERQLAAAEARFEPDGVAYGRGYEPDGLPLELRPHPGGADDERHYPDPFTASARAARAQRRAYLRRAGWGRAARYEAARRVGGRHVAQQRWHRPIAWVLAVVMGVSVVAVAVAAIYRGTGGSDTESPRRPESGTSSPGVTTVPSPSVPALLPR